MATHLLSRRLQQRRILVAMLEKHFSAFIAIFLHFAFNLITCFAWNSLSEGIHITVIIIVIICSLIVDINISISMPPTRINHHNYASSKTSITIKTTVIVFLMITSIFNMECYGVTFSVKSKNNKNRLFSIFVLYISFNFLFSLQFSLLKALILDYQVYFPSCLFLHFRR